MPELPEVERATQLLKLHALGKTVKDVQTTEDVIVYSGASHSEFASEIKDRTVLNVARYGKVFYIELDGEGRMPVLHFGMTGNIRVKGQMPLYYKEGPTKYSDDWPPRFMKFIITLALPGDPLTTTEIAFLDARRLARIRLCLSPLTEAPISALGFDPLLSMIPLEEFSKAVLRRTCPIKALLLDQSFSAGIGNWIADEVLYHARVHPEERCNLLKEEQIIALHQQIVTVCRTATDLNADASKFPDNWLFSHRWGKGKKKKKGKVDAEALKLPSGDVATIKFVTVGGRTSAYVSELQRLNDSSRISKRTQKEIAQAENAESSEESELTALSDSDEASIVPVKRVTRASMGPTSIKKRTKLT